MYSFCFSINNVYGRFFPGRFFPWALFSMGAFFLGAFFRGRFLPWALFSWALISWALFSVGAFYRALFSGRFFPWALFTASHITDIIHLIKIFREVNKIQYVNGHKPGKLFKCIKHLEIKRISNMQK